ncbi:Hypothetical predicted protein [Cloeon dipterum]|uniref:Glucuronosyltransferase n=1 Tax=Cloeon dipterum TaxID=197152 RepID=A0A8S1C2P2_9INSE|nr:Hypothetical predicted protein [Cloeon dipterum]
MKYSRISTLFYLLMMFSDLLAGVNSDSIFMITMGGTKSHTVPFAALSRALVARGHNVTMLSAFPGVAEDAGAEELCPDGLVEYVNDFTKDWDLLGSRMKGDPPISPWKALQYGYQVCEATLSDPLTKHFLHSGRNFDLLLLDGAYSACALGFVHHFSAPYMLINTVGLYLAPLAALGNPEPFAITPFFNSGYTEKMNVMQRMANGAAHIFCRAMHWLLLTFTIQPILNKAFGPSGHPKVVALVSHGGLLSMFEAAYHAKPTIMLPVFCDHDANAAKAAADGYAIKLELQGLTADRLVAAINRAIKDPTFRHKAELHSRYLLDQPISPLESAVFWTEYILRHRGAPRHLQGAALRDLSFIEWLYLDILTLLLVAFYCVRRTATLISKCATRMNCTTKKLKEH